MIEIFSPDGVFRVRASRSNSHPLNVARREFDIGRIAALSGCGVSYRRRMDRIRANNSLGSNGFGK